MRKSSVNNILSKAGGLYAGARGFSLVEMLIAMAVGMVVLGAMYGVFNIQSKTLGNQEEIVAMQQSVRAGMDMMAREIGMAGYNPAGATFAGVTYDTSDPLQLRIMADLNGDGDTGDESEDIVYKYYNSSEYPYQIKRKTGGGDFQPFVENVQSFDFVYLKSDGIAATTASADVRQIRITITGRTAKPDSSYTPNGGYRTYTLTSVIAPMNLAF